MIRNICAALVLLFTYSCAPTRTVELRQMEGDWELSVFPRGDKTFSEIFGQRRPALSFAAAGKFSGTTGCNRMTGSYSKVLDRIRFTNIGLTKMTCNGYNEQLFLQALARVNRYQLSEQKLELLADSTVLMVFSPIPPGGVAY